MSLENNNIPDQPFASNLSLLLSPRDPQQTIIIWQEMLSGSRQADLRTGANIIMALFGRCPRDPNSRYGLQTEIVVRQEELAGDLGVNADAVRMALNRIFTRQEKTGFELIARTPLEYYQNESGQIRCAPYSYNLTNVCYYLMILWSHTQEQLQDPSAWSGLRLVTKEGMTEMDMFRRAARRARLKVFAGSRPKPKNPKSERSQFTHLRAAIKALMKLAESSEITALEAHRLLYEKDKFGNAIIDPKDREWFIKFLNDSRFNLDPNNQIIFEEDPKVN